MASPRVLWPVLEGLVGNIIGSSLGAGVQAAQKWLEAVKADLRGPQAPSDASISTLTDLAGTVTDIGSGAVDASGFIIRNDDSADRYVQLFNVAAASVTLGTTLPDMLYEVMDDDTIFVALNSQYGGYRFETALSAAATTTATGATAATNLDMWAVIRE